MDTNDLVGDATIYRRMNMERGAGSGKSNYRYLSGSRRWSVELRRWVTEWK